MQQQLALGQGIKHLMALETTGFGIDDMEMKRRSKIDLDWMSAMPFRVHQLNGGRELKIARAPTPFKMGASKPLATSTSKA